MASFNRLSCCAGCGGCPSNTAVTFSAAADCGTISTYTGRLYDGATLLTSGTLSAFSPNLNIPTTVPLGTTITWEAVLSGYATQTGTFVHTACTPYSVTFSFFQYANLPTTLTLTDPNAVPITITKTGSFWIGAGAGGSETLHYSWGSIASIASGACGGFFASPCGLRMDYQTTGACGPINDAGGTAVSISTGGQSPTSINSVNTFQADPFICTFSFSGTAYNATGPGLVFPGSFGSPALWTVSL